MDEIRGYQVDCFHNYKKDIGLPQNYAYLYGNPVNALVPVETAVNQFMIVGAYPSAKFFTIDGIPNTPVSDIDFPFSNETYFDGSRVRTIPSGRELDEMLKEIGVERQECWITNLVKVFLFKKGHVNRYNRLNKHDIEENRSRYDEFAQKSVPWLKREIKIANPKLIILLGVEVTKNIFNISKVKAKHYLDGERKSIQIDGVLRNVICLPHPGILMKDYDRNPWRKLFKNEIVPKARLLVRDIKMGR
ncbi:MAG: hypothetical protein DRP63_04965 [Planctomycetota bacterium]|nr:MAG: hypothetical protein DRP63_04965 [Planctomycetota bacterium]